ncbi:MAG: FlgD immunoglobulin-like domain containing protein [Candidatus Fermentibacteraceae bacterium]
MAVAAGSAHSLGLKEDGSIVAWGDNSYGQCTIPSPNSGFVGIAAGEYHSLGLHENSTWVEGACPAGDFIQIQSVSPNPFSTSTSVVFHSPGISTLTLEVYDTAGRLMRTRSLGNSPAGQHTTVWDGRDSQGAELGSGVYFIRLSGTEQQASAKVVLVR